MYKKVYLYAIIMLLISVGAFFLPLSLRVPIIDIITFVTAFIASFAFFYLAIYSKKVYQKYYPTLLFLGFGLFFLALGDVAWFILDLLGQEPFPSIADLLYILYYPLFGIGLLITPVERKTEKFTAMCDFCIISAAVATILWLFFLKPVILSGGSLIEVLVSAIYIIGDFIGLFILIDFIMNKIGLVKSRAINIFLAGIIILLLSDLLFSYGEFHGLYYSGCLIDLGWIIGYLLLAVSAIEFRLEDFETPVYSQKRAWVMEYFPDFFILSLFILFLFVLFNFNIKTSQSFAIAFLIILSFAVGRHHGTLLENRKLIEDLNAEKNRAELYLKIAAWGLIFLDDKGRIQYINRRGLEILEGSEDDVKGKSWFSNFVPADERLEREKKYFKHIKEAKGYNVTGKVITCKGNEKIMQMTAKPIYENGEFKGAIIAAEDMTKLYHIRRKLEESEKRYRSIFNTAPSIILSLGNDLKIQDCNRMVSTLGYKPNELIGKNINDILEDKIKEPTPGEYRIKKKDDSILYAKINFSKLEDEMIVVMEDITPLKESIREKELLLREIHHRVKNNLQIISSLLSIQERKTSNQNFKDILSSSNERIKSIALLHEQLYQSTDLANVKIKDYIKNLATKTLQAYPTDIQIETDIEDITLNIETSLPIGLIINELLTNTIKHANAKNVEIRLKKVNGNLKLHYKDDGKGLTKDEIQKSEGLGWKLIKSLTSQLGGKLTIKNKKGLDLMITFKELRYKKRY